MDVPIDRVLVRFVVDLLELRHGAGQQVGRSVSHIHIARGVHSEVKKTKLVGGVFLVLLVLDELNAGLDDVRSVGPGPVARELPFRGNGAPGKPREAIIGPPGVGELRQNIQGSLKRERKISKSYLCTVHLVGIRCDLECAVDVILLVIQHRLVHQRRSENMRDIGRESNVCTVPAG